MGSSQQISLFRRTSLHHTFSSPADITTFQREIEKADPYQTSKR